MAGFYFTSGVIFQMLLDIIFSFKFDRVNTFENF